MYREKLRRGRLRKNLSRRLSRRVVEIQCEDLEGVKVEITHAPFFLTEVKKHRLVLVRERGERVSLEEAKADYLEDFGEAYEAGVSDCYCAFCCSKSGVCSFYNDRMKKLRP